MSFFNTVFKLTQFCRDSYSSFTSYLHWMPWYPKHQESLQRQPACRLPHRNGADNYGDLEPRGQAFGFGVSGMRERVEVCAHLFCLRRLLRNHLLIFQSQHRYFGFSLVLLLFWICAYVLLFLTIIVFSEV